jgi:MerR family copper efflux transcriptional regulator
MESVPTLDTDGQGGSLPERLTLAQAAQRLGHSEKTLRRWVKSGRLPAALEAGPYGPQYWVSTHAVQAAQQALEVVTVERTPDRELLALAVAQVLEQRDAGLRAELVSIQAKLDTLLSRVDTPPAQRPEPTAAPWWRNWWAALLWWQR